MTTPRMGRQLQSGRKGQVVGVVLPNGTCPAFDFLSGLATPVQTRFRALLERLCDVGFLRAPETMRRLEVAGDPRVHEIKVHNGPGYRLYVVQEHRLWIATHGVKKPKDSRVASEVERARVIYREGWA